MSVTKIIRVNRCEFKRDNIKINKLYERKPRFDKNKNKN